MHVNKTDLNPGTLATRSRSRIRGFRFLFDGWTLVQVVELAYWSIRFQGSTDRRKIPGRSVSLSRVITLDCTWYAHIAVPVRCASFSKPESHKRPILRPTTAHEKQQVPKNPTRATTCLRRPARAPTHFGEQPLHQYMYT